MPETTRTSASLSASPSAWPPPWLFIWMPLTNGIFTGYVQTAMRGFCARWASLSIA